MAFRALTSLDDPGVYATMRQVIVSGTEVSYRLGAIRYLADQGDQEALPLLQRIITSPDEQPSVREAAERAYLEISGDP